MKLIIFILTALLMGCVGSEPIQCGNPSNFIVNKIAVSDMSEKSMEK